MRDLIDPLAYKDMEASSLELEFAHRWVEEYPHLDLITQVRFHPQRRFRADFASGQKWQWRARKGIKERSLLLPPGILIECQGGIHRIKFDTDAEKESLALQLGFKYHRVHWQTLKEKIPQIAEDIMNTPSTKRKPL